MYAQALSSHHLPATVRELFQEDTTLMRTIASLLIFAAMIVLDTPAFRRRFKEELLNKPQKFVQNMASLDVAQLIRLFCRRPVSWWVRVIGRPGFLVATKKPLIAALT